jgi:hypothetical protein
VEKMTDNLIKCSGCGKILEEGSSIYVISLAHVTQNNDEEWDYEREEDDSHWCMDCGGKLPQPKE